MVIKVFKSICFNTPLHYVVDDPGQRNQHKIDSHFERNIPTLSICRGLYKKEDIQKGFNGIYIWKEHAAESQTNLMPIP
jgi:hypothetical protein